MDPDAQTSKHSVEHTSEQAPKESARPSPGAEPTDDRQRRRVAAVLARVKAGTRQRRAERATVGTGREEARLALLELRQTEFVREPVPVSPRPLFGGLLIFARKAFYHLFLKWHARGVLAQQNAYNQAASRLLEELSRSHEALRQEVDRLGRRVEGLERDRREQERGQGTAGRPDAADDDTAESTPGAEANA